MGQINQQPNQPGITVHAYTHDRLSYFGLPQRATLAPLCGLLELPLDCSTYYLPAGLLLFSSFFRRAFFFHFSFCFCGPLLCICHDIYTSMLTSIYREHSTAQRNQPCTKQQSKDVPIRAPQPKHAYRAGESLEPACRAKAFIQLYED